MSGSIFLIREEGGLVELNEQPYDSEERLQALLADYPNLLGISPSPAAGDARWLRVKREMGVPAAEDGGNWWYLDHLFLDHDGVPTLVEVKRASDTRLRREVVGQMLDYAANAVVYWPVERIRAAYGENCRIAEADPDVRLADFLGEDADSAAFWQAVKINLQAGRIRMIFVADQIPGELRRIVEFLNSQMDPAEVLAVEIRQHVSEGLRTLVTSVFGDSAESKRRKGGPDQGPGEPWTEGSFLQEISARQGESVAAVARSILTWALDRQVKVEWGRGRHMGSFWPVLNQSTRAGRPFVVYFSSKEAYVEVRFQYVLNDPPFDDRSVRLDLWRRLNEIPGINIPQDKLDLRPSFTLKALTGAPASAKFMAILDWLLSIVNAPSRDVLPET